MAQATGPQTIDDSPAVQPHFGRLEWATLLFVASAIIYQLFIPPVVGMADNGDFRRVYVPRGLKLDVPEGERHWGYVHRKYLKTEKSYAHFMSSQGLLVLVAQGINSLISKRGPFDILVLGAVHSALWLFGAALVLRGARGLGKSARYVLPLGVAVIMTEVGYIAFFNSFFMESASLIGAVLLIGFGMLLGVSVKARLWCLVGFFVSSALFVTAKTQNVPLVLFVVGFGLIGSRRWRKWQPKALALVLAVCTLVAAKWMYGRGSPGVYKTQILWNAVFYNMLPHSPTPEQDLESLGFDGEWRQYIGRHCMEAPLSLPFGMFHKRIGGWGRVFSFYARRPMLVYDLFRRCARGTFVLRFQNLGNFEKSAGLPFGTQSQAFSFWGRFRSAVMPRSIWFLAALFGSLLAGGAFEWWRQRRRGPSAGLIPLFVVMIVLMAVSQFSLVVLTDGESDLEKHLLLFNLLCDACLLTGLLWVSNWAAIGLGRYGVCLGRWRRASAEGAADG